MGGLSSGIYIDDLKLRMDRMKNAERATEMAEIHVGGDARLEIGTNITSAT